MTPKQRGALLVTSLVGWTVGNGLLPILPTYAAELHINPALTGYYMGTAYLALMLGTVCGGLISDRWQVRRLPLIVMGVTLVPVLLLMGSADGFWPLLIWTCLAWFLGGLGLALVNILAGLVVSPERRGALFGWMALTSALGALLGGATLGPMAEEWGFPAMFVALAAFALTMPVVAVFLPEAGRREKVASLGKARLPKAFGYLMGAVFVASVARFMGTFATSVVMHSHDLGAGAISGTAAVGGAIALPLPALLGRLSDRYGRSALLWACYGAGAIGLVVLAVASTLPLFWTAAVFLAILGYASMGVGSALVTDLVPTAQLGRSLAAFNGLNLAGGVVGLAATGQALTEIGKPATLGFAIALLVVASGFLWSVGPRRQPQANATSH